MRHNCPRFGGPLNVYAAELPSTLAIQRSILASSTPSGQRLAGPDQPDVASARQLSGLDALLAQPSFSFDRSLGLASRPDVPPQPGPDDEETEIIVFGFRNLGDHVGSVPGGGGGNGTLLFGTGNYWNGSNGAQAPAPVDSDNIHPADGQEATEIVVEGTLATLKDMMAKYGEVKVTIPGGYGTIKLSNLIKQFEKTLTVVQARELLLVLSKGDEDVITAIAFIAGFVAGAALSSKSALVAWAASTLATWATDKGLRMLNEMITDTFNSALGQNPSDVGMATGPNRPSAGNFMDWLRSQFSPLPPRF